MRTWKDVATLVKTRNLKGRFVARPAAGLPFLLEEGMHVAFVPPQTDVPREGVVTHVAELDRGSFEVAFDTVDNDADANGLIGCHCLVRRELLDEFDFVDDHASWEGWSVVDARGVEIGEVVNLVENPAHPLLEVKRTGQAANAFIPVVDEFIVEVDEGVCTVVVELPVGLLDL